MAGVGVQLLLLLEAAAPPTGGDAAVEGGGSAVALDRLGLATAMWSLLARQAFFVSGHTHSFGRLHVAAAFVGCD
jgi:hypothetical protein